MASRIQYWKLHAPPKTPSGWPRGRKTQLDYLLRLAFADRVCRKFDWAIFCVARAASMAKLKTFKIWLPWWCTTWRNNTAYSRNQCTYHAANR